MKTENRNVIPFLDNATCHPKVTLSNVKIAWFPANATSALQPMDMDVIYTFKSHYRRFLTLSLILNVEEANSSYALARSVSVLNGVNLIVLAVKKIKEETVKKCSANAGFGESDVSDNLEELSENIAAVSNLC
jgi:ADP-dependent phosphofructokinase/glucokinase